MALLGQHAERMAAGQLPCRHAKVHISYALEHDLDLEGRIPASFLHISHGGFSSLLCPPCLLDECFTMSYKKIHCFIQSPRDEAGDCGPDHSLPLFRCVKQLSSLLIASA